jgi:hypothetical protein
VRAKAAADWANEDAFVIGGGASLRTFDFDWLRDRATLGVNDAYKAGPSRCSRVLFGDGKFWKQNKWELEEYAKAGGIVYSVSLDTIRFNLPWVWQFNRGVVGMSIDPGTLGWNHNTGASALNLALLLGAKRVFLLGFDMTDVGGLTHWHNNRIAPTSKESLGRFMRGFEYVFAHMNLFPGREVLNVTDGISKLPLFARISVAGMKEVV